MNIDKILNAAVRGGASDIILKTGSIPRFRYHGKLTSLQNSVEVTNALMLEWIKKIAPASKIKELQEKGDIDCRYTPPEGNSFRVNIFKVRGALGMVLRVLSNNIKSSSELQLPEVVDTISQNKRGLVLVTGATGSGKSTTLAAMLQHVNLTSANHIITIEDPIEYLFNDAKSTITQREIGSDCISFEQGLKAALRQNPNIIMVGELRTQSTVEIALQAAETGHLVMATMHTSNAKESISRVLSLFEPEKQKSIRNVLAANLKAILSQRLVPRESKKGMIACFEIALINQSIKEIILKEPSFDRIDNIIKSSKKTYGMQSFDSSLIELYNKGVITRETALKEASNPNDVELLLSGIAS